LPKSHYQFSIICRGHKNKKPYQAEIFSHLKKSLIK